MNDKAYIMRTTARMAIHRRSSGISPLLAVIILITITVVGGLLVYSLFISSAATASSKAFVSVETAQVIVPTGSTSGLVTITLKNTGNRPVATIAVVLRDNGASLVSQTPATNPVLSFTVSGSAISSSNPLAPGISTSASGTATTTGQVTGAAAGTGCTGAGSTTCTAMTFTIGNSYPYTVTTTFSDGSTFAVSGTVVASSS